MGRRGFSHATKGPSMGAVSRSFLVFTLSSAAAWLWTCVEIGRLPG